MLAILAITLLPLSPCASAANTPQPQPALAANTAQPTNASTGAATPPSAQAANTAQSPASRVAVDSVRAVESSPIVRSNLTPEESAADQPAMITLNLRNVDELKARIAKGDIISPQEMQEKYYPTHEDWQTVAFWAQSQGLTVEPENMTHMSVKTHGQASITALAFQTQLSRVLGSDDVEYTAAVTPASVPSEIAPKVSGVLKLQPQHHARPATTYQPISSTGLYYGPQYMLDNYGATGVGDGTGQTIAIFGFAAPPSPTDLTTYWAKIGSPHTLADVTVVNPSGFAPFNDDMSGGITAGYEVTMDVEIATGLCPGAKVRVYCLTDITSVAEAVLADLPNNPSIHELTYSGGDTEVTSPTADSQYFMALAAQGVSVFAASGDAGSNISPMLFNGNLQVYSSVAPLAVDYPASDPYVTGVGGTSEQLNYAGGPGNNQGPVTGVLAELAWTQGTLPNNGTNYVGGGSGGGISSIFSRPSWQTGPGVPSGTMRTVPDVAAAADGADGFGFYIYDGAHDNEAGGTSEAAPIWAALTAILNENLGAKGHAAVGLLNSKIYPLAGTGAMNYVTQGKTTWVFANTPGETALPSGTVDTNGAYAVGPTYDCITGIGTPNIAMIAAALEAPPAGLSVSVATKLPSGAVVNGSSPITLQASATGSPTTYQWNLNGVPIAGATGATEIVYPTAANEGDYTVVVTNSAGSASTDAGTLNITTDAWIVNLSSRAYAETGANLLIAGFVTTGPDAKTLLIRGVGPQLGAFSISDYLADPKLTLFSQSGTVLDSTTSWSSTLDATFAQVGAFALTAGSKDTALLETLPAAPYTAQVISSSTNNGVALAEIYDADNTAPTNRLINISARAFVGTNANILIGGFVIGGNTPQTVIIRADGPTLGSLGVPGVLANPVLTLFDHTGAVIGTDVGWTNTPTTGPAATGGIVVQPLTAALSKKVGAFALGATAADSGIVATLPPGAYTAQVTGSAGGTGVALVEIYEIR